MPFYVLKKSPAFRKVLQATLLREDVLTANTHLWLELFLHSNDYEQIATNI